MGKAERISSVFWLCFGLVACIESYRAGLGTLHMPGPGFLFFWSGVVLCLMSLIILIPAWAGRKNEKVGETIFGEKFPRKVVLVPASILVYAILMEPLGFIPATLLLFLFILRMVEKKGWLFAIWVSVLVTAAAYMIFDVWLQAQLPKGVLENVRFLRF